MRTKRIGVLAILLLALPLVAVFATGQQEGAADAGPVEIDWFVAESWFTRPWDLDRPVDSIFTERTGVTINFQNNAGQDEMLNTMIASGDLPDVMSMGWYYSQWQQLQDAEMLVALDEVVPESHPQLWAGFANSMIGWWTYGDGHLYGYPGHTIAEEEMTEDNYLPTNVNFIAREDILDELGLTAEDFQTKEGFIQSLKMVKESGHTYNGIEVDPFWFFTNGGEPGGLVWYSTFAVTRENDAGQLVDMRLQPRYLEMMLFLNRLYREGLIQRENLTADRTQIAERIISGRVFALSSNTGAVEEYIKDFYTSDGIRYVPIGPVFPEDGTRPAAVPQATIGWLMNMISADSEKIQPALDAWEFMRSEEGQFLMNYGVEGEHYTLHSDGRIRWTEDYLEILESPDITPLEAVGNDYLWILSSTPWRQRHNPPPANPGIAMEEDLYRYFGEYAYDDTAFTNIGPFGGTDEAGINAEITTYWEEQIPKMVLAETEAEARGMYEESVERMLDMGLDDVLALQNENFQTNKEKLGIDYAWPYAGD